MRKATGIVWRPGLEPFRNVDRPTSVRLVMLMALTMVTSACLGSDHDSPSGLEITVRFATSPGDAGRPEAFRTERYSLDCGRPPRGTMPDPAVACTAIADLGLPHNRTACQTLGQPVMGTLVVTGSFRAKPVDLRLTTASWCGASADVKRDYEALLLPNPAVVPSVVGLPLLGAAAALQRAGFTVSIAAPTSFGSLMPMPLVDGQSVTAGVLAERSTDVAVTVRSRCCLGSPGAGKPRVRMPRLVGLNARQAISRLRHAGLEWVIRLEPVAVASHSILGAYVVRQSPQPGVILASLRGGFHIPQFTADYGRSSNG